MSIIGKIIALGVLTVGIPVAIDSGSTNTKGNKNYVQQNVPAQEYRDIEVRIANTGDIFTRGPAMNAELWQKEADKVTIRRTCAKLLQKCEKLRIPEDACRTLINTCEDGAKSIF